MAGVLAACASSGPSDSASTRVTQSIEVRVTGPLRGTVPVSGQILVTPDGTHDADVSRVVSLGTDARIDVGEFAPGTYTLAVKQLVVQRQRGDGDTEEVTLLSPILKADGARVTVPLTTAGATLSVAPAVEGGSAQVLVLDHESAPVAGAAVDLTTRRRGELVTATSQTDADGIAVFPLDGVSSYRVELVSTPRGLPRRHQFHASHPIGHDLRVLEPVPAFPLITLRLEQAGALVAVLDGGVSGVVLAQSPRRILTLLREHSWDRWALLGPGWDMEWTTDPESGTPAVVASPIPLGRYRVAVQLIGFDRDWIDVEVRGERPSTRVGFSPSAGSPAPPWR